MTGISNVKRTVMKYDFLQVSIHVFAFLTEEFTISRRYIFYINCIAYVCIGVYIIDTLQHNRFSCVRSCFAFLFSNMLATELYSVIHGETTTFAFLQLHGLMHTDG